MSPRAFIAFLRRFGVLVRAFGAARGGVAAVEFALIAPLLLFLYVGSTELSQLITVDSRVATISGTIGDLVARSNGSITTGTLDSYFTAAERILQPFPTDELKQVVTLVRVKPDKSAEVEWSKSYNGATAYNAGDAFELDQEMINVAIQSSKDAFVVVSETRYSHMPLLGMVFDTPMPLYHENFYMPRFDGIINLS